MPSHCRAKNCVTAACCAFMPGVLAASRQKASWLRKAWRSAANGHCVHASWRKRGSSSSAPRCSSPGVPPALMRTPSAPSRTASAARSICRPGDCIRCQAQSAQASDSDTGDKLRVNIWALAAWTSRSRRWVGVSGVQAPIVDASEAFRLNENPGEGEHRAPHAACARHLSERSPRSDPRTLRARRTFNHECAPCQTAAGKAS